MPRKVIPGKNYGSMPHLSGSKLGAHDRYLTPGQEAIIKHKVRDRHDTIYVTRKLDGTNVGILRKGNELITVQRKGYGCVDSPYEQHRKFDEHVQTNRDKYMAALNDGERLVGEWLWQASGILYWVPQAPFYAFDLFRPDGGRISYPLLVARCNEHAIEQPFLFHTRRGKPLGAADDFSAWVDPTDFPRPVKERHEGIVVRVERKGVYDFMAKWVRPDYVGGKYLPGLHGLSEDAPITLNIPDHA